MQNSINTSSLKKISIISIVILFCFCGLKQEKVEKNFKDSVSRKLGTASDNLLYINELT